MENLGALRLLHELSSDPLGRTYRAVGGGEVVDRILLVRRFDGADLDSRALARCLVERTGGGGAPSSPFVASAVSAGEADGSPFLAWDYLPARWLADVRDRAERRMAPLPGDQALLVLERVAQALIALRAAGAGHGFVVPELILTSTEGEVKLLGAEVAPALRQQPPSTLRPYLDPDLRLAGAPSEAEEVWSLGRVLLELLTGRRADAGDDLPVLVAGATLAEDEGPLPEPVRQLLARSLGAGDRRIVQLAAWHAAARQAMADAGWQASAFNLAFFMHGLVGREVDEEQEAASAPAAPARQPPAPPGATTARTVSALQAPAAATPAGEVASRERRGPLLALAVGSAALAALALVTWLALARDGDQATPPPTAPEAVAAPRSARPSTAAAEEPATEPVAAPEVDPRALEAEVDRLLREREQALASGYRQELEELEQEIAARQRQQAQAAQPPAAPTRDERTSAAAANAPAPAPATRAPATPGAGDRAAPPPAAADAAPDSPRAAPTREPPASGDPPASPAATTAETAPPAQPAPAVRRGDLVTPGPGVTLPRVRRLTPPQYTPQARRLRVAGTVILSALIDEEGRVQEVEVLKGIPQDVGLNEAAARAVRAARFEPATKDGVAVKIWHTVSIPFTL